MMESSNKAKTQKQYIASVIANGAMFSTGMALGWMSPVQAQITADENGECSNKFCVSQTEIAWIATVMAIGSLAICSVASATMTAIGRKLSLIGFVVATIAGWASLTFAQSSWMLYVGRVLVGIGFGGSGVIVPVYVGEISQTSIRGRLLSFKHVFQQSGILLSSMLGYFFAMFGQNLASLSIITILGIAMFIIPESPRYYVYNDRLKDADASLKWLRGKTYDPDEEIKDMIDFQNSQEKKGMKVLFAEETNRRALFISFGLMIGFHLSGTGYIVFYTASIFRDANINIDPDLAVTILGICSLVSSIIAAHIVDKVGRKVLLLVSLFTVFVCCVVMGIYFQMKSNNPESVAQWGVVPVIILCIFKFANSLGIAPIAFVIMGEIFRQNVKDVAAGLTMTLNYGLSIVVTLLFPYISRTFGADVCFYIFAICSLLSLFFVIYIVPETKGKSFQEIQDSLVKKK